MKKKIILVVDDEATIRELPAIFSLSRKIGCDDRVMALVERYLELK